MTFEKEAISSKSEDNVTNFEVFFTYPEQIFLYITYILKGFPGNIYQQSICNQLTII